MFWGDLVRMGVVERSELEVERAEGSASALVWEGEGLHVRAGVGDWLRGEGLKWLVMLIAVNFVLSGSESTRGVSAPIGYFCILFGLLIGNAFIHSLNESSAEGEAMKRVLGAGWTLGFVSSDRFNRKVVAVRFGRDLLEIVGRDGALTIRKGGAIGVRVWTSNSGFSSWLEPGHSVLELSCGEEVLEFSVRDRGRLAHWAYESGFLEAR